MKRARIKETVSRHDSNTKRQSTFIMTHRNSESSILRPIILMKDNKDARRRRDVVGPPMICIQAGNPIYNDDVLVKITVKT